MWVGDSVVKKSCLQLVDFFFVAIVWPRVCQFFFLFASGPHNPALVLIQTSIVSRALHRTYIIGTTYLVVGTSCLKFLN